MNKLAQFAGWGGVAAAGGLTVALLTGILDFGKSTGTDAPSEAVAVPAGEGTKAAVPDTGASQAPAAETAAPPAADSAPQPDAVTEPATLRAPGFDIVRVDPQGMVVVAGYGEASARVSILVDGGEQAEARVGPDGKFVSLLELPPVTSPRVFRLRQTLGDSVVESEQEVILAPSPVEVARLEPAPAAADDAVREASGAAPEAAPVSGDEAETVGDDVAPAPDLPAEAAPVAVEIATAPAEAPAAVSGIGPEADAASAGEMPSEAPETEAAQASSENIETAAVAPAPAADPQPPAVFLSDVSGVEVLTAEPLAAGDVALDAITYDDSGAVLLSGRGENTASVRIYLDNEPLTTSRIREDGRWRITLPDIASGTYTLRVDQVDDSGAVTARVESPFRRESPETLDAAAELAEWPVSAITVQPGNTLWAIARDRYGEGLDYVRVYEANRDRIRDPDLIYPGQIFDLPDG